MQTLPNLVASLAERLGLEPPAADSKALHHLQTPDGLAFSLSALDKRTILLQACITELPSPRREAEELCRKFLCLNRPRLATRNESLALEARSNMLILQRVARIDDGGQETFMQLVEDFLNALGYWQTQTAPKPRTPMPEMLFIRP